MDLLQHITEGELSSTIFFLSIFLFLVILLLININRPQKPKYKLPPSPFKLPIIGNLHQVRGGSLHCILHSLAQKHGSLMIIHLGCLPTLVVSSVDAAREIIKTYDYCFSGRPQLIIPRRLTYYGKDIAFAQYGEHWRELRRVCVVKLLNAKKAQSCSPLRIQEVRLMIDKIMEFWLWNSAVNLSQIFISFTNNMICKVAFGKKYGEGESIKAFKKIVKEFTTLLGAVDVGDMIPSLSWVNHFNGLNKRVDKNIEALNSFLDMIVQEHLEKRTTVDNGEGGDEEEDIVDIMLGIEKDNTLGFDRDVTKAMLLDMFAGGTDTTSVVLEWGMSELLKNPEIMKEVQGEVRDVAKGKLVLDEGDTKEMPFLRSVIKETLRMHPPFPLVPRETSEKVILQGYDIPANSRVMLSMYAIGRDPLYWDEPDKFWPKRFMEGKSASVDFRGQDIQLIPFGAGRRGCPGIYFATPSLELVFANILNRFDWVLPEGVTAEHLDMDEGTGMTAYRKNELLLTVTPFY